MQLKLFYHMTPSPMLENFFVENKKYMQQCNLWDAFDEINFIVHHDRTNYSFLDDQLQIDKRCKLIQDNTSHYRLEEQYTNRIIKDICDQSEHDFILLRFHNKGLTYISEPGYPDPMKLSYTKITNEGNIGCWQEAVEKLLTDVDCAGINWVQTPWPHFVGNVWWAKSSYIKKLIKLKLPHETGFVQQIPGKGTYIVHDAESWIGTANPRSWDLLNKTSDYVLHPNPFFR
jgi:hypothetical protein